MKYSIPLFLFIIIASCKKEQLPPGTATLTVINAVADGVRLVTNFTGTDSIKYLNARSLTYSSSSRLIRYVGQQQVGFYKWPDTTSKDKPLFNLSLDLPVGSISTLVLTGTSTNPDTVFVRDQISYFPATDSSMEFSFANFSPGRNVRVRIKGSTATEAQLSYKTITSFKRYAVASTVADYVFEFVDETDRVVATYTTVGIRNAGAASALRWIQGSFTLALVGLPGATGTYAQKLIMINHAQFIGIN
ncbi:MAG: hypothetical protein P0Y53_14375 [Candidatus Pseudobacter hemicellulosilyticus]|uniref:DUF4397 domain-containing protein n=1 Tax=Candidatus Pseudobacter hemicellulosilyticus TaxID=3121375 RepID=A0AAJ5WSI9_9BACT|nr:MAG: hypothetical protein P0Y53_14375 [Pseudobacter sp.]